MALGRVRGWSPAPMSVAVTPSETNTFRWPFGLWYVPVIIPALLMATTSAWSKPTRVISVITPSRYRNGRAMSSAL